MKEIKATISTISLLFWILLTVLFYLLIIRMDWPSWTLGLTPSFIIFHIIMLKRTKYIFGEDKLSIIKPFDRLTIEFSSIKSYSINKTNFFKQLFLGLPKETISIDYNKYDRIEVFLMDKEMLNAFTKATD